jgi:hypothetical protein
VSVAFASGSAQPAAASSPGAQPAPHADARSSSPLAQEPPPQRDSAQASKRHGWSPWVVAVEGALTVIVGGATIGSAVDTRRARDAFQLAPSEQALASGRSKELRTNVLLAVTGGMALVTAATALWLVDWGGGDRAGGATTALFVTPLAGDRGSLAAGSFAATARTTF